MSSITPLSFVDDHIEIDRRMPKRGQRIIKWLTDTDTNYTSITDSTYTGSFIDDGADIIFPSNLAPGFGVVDRRFYDPGKNSDKDGLRNPDIEKAIGGDVRRSLGAMKNLANVQVQDAKGRPVGRKREARADDRKVAVNVKMPPPWGTFIIKGEDGRVVVVDEHGEYDSGPPGEEMGEWRPSRSRKNNRHELEGKDKRNGEESRRPLETYESARRATRSTKEHQRSEDAKRSVSGNKHSRRTTMHHKRSSPLPPKGLSPIPEAAMLETGDSIMSPTKFITTGSVGGWSPSSLSPTQPLSPSASPTRSIPGGWPSSPPSPLEKASYALSSPMSPAKSLVPSSMGSLDSWVDVSSWGQAATKIKLPSSVASTGYARTLSSIGTPTIRQDIWDAKSSREDTDFPICREPLESAESQASSTTESNASWKRDVEAFNSRFSLMSVLGQAPSATGSKVPEMRKAHSNSPRHSTAPRHSAVTPYSWRREVEEESNCSTQGSPDRRAPSAAMSGSSWLGEDVKAQSVRAISVYRAPTVEDAAETSQEEVQEHKTSINGASTAGWGGGSTRDKSGYAEDNDTWLNSEAGGVRYREAEWRRKGTWRDV